MNWIKNWRSEEYEVHQATERLKRLGLHSSLIDMIPKTREISNALHLPSQNRNFNRRQISAR